MTVSNFPITSAGRGLLRAAILALALIAAGPAGVALAEPPQLTIESPANESVTASPTPSFSGATNDESDELVLDIYAGTDLETLPVQTLSTAFPSATWSLGPATPLPDGTYTAVASQSNGLETGTSSVTFTIDTPPPSVAVSSPVNGAYLNSSQPTFSGSADDESKDDSSVVVSIYAGSSVTGSPEHTLEVTRSGASWSTGSSGPHLADGTYTVQASQSDVAGNTGQSEPVTFTVDTTPPVVSVSSPVNGAYLNSSQPTFSGSAGNESGDDSSMVVSIYAGSSVSGSPEHTLEVTRSGASWSTGSSGPHLADGTYTVQASQSDKAGNTGKSPPVTFTVDTVAPSVGVSSPVNGAYLKSSKPTFSGSAGNESGDDSSVVVSIYRGSSVSGSPEHTLEVTRSGTSWSSGSLGPTLADGTYTVQASQSDKAGNTGTSSPITFTIDTTPPKVSLNSIASPSKEPTPTLTGAAGVEGGDASTVTVTIYKGGSVGGTVAESKAVSGAGGTWSYLSPHLADGVYTAQATQTDLAGNTGMSKAATFTVDTTPPAVTITSPTNGSSLTKSSRPTFAGNAGNASEAGGTSNDGPSVVLSIYAGSSASGTPEQTLEVTRSGASWTTGISGPELKNGTYTVQATQSDAVGNVGKSAPVTFTVNTPAPSVGISSPVSGAYLNIDTPSFTGASTPENTEPAVTVKIYKGEVASGKPVEEKEALESAGTWTIGAVPRLSDGTYIAQAQQTDDAHNIGYSETTKFTIDTVPPIVTLASPEAGSTSEGSLVVQGAASTDPGDKPGIKIKLFAGPTTGGELVEEHDVSASSGSWKSPFAGLSPGTYTVQAEQEDKAGNVGVSGPVTFTVTAPVTPEPTVTSTSTSPSSPTPSAPAASFEWSPSTPQTGEGVTLVSTSTDPQSALTAFAWSLASTGPFAAGSPTLTTSFSTPGGHVVRLRVTDGAGASSEVAKTIEVVAPKATLMQPFPVVRFAGNDTPSGVRLKLLTVLAPAGATVTVTCKGHGCPVKSLRKLAKSTKSGMVLLAFPRFERSLRAGVILEVRVSKAGEIGKYTRFVVRRGKLPERVDLCLHVSGSTPLVCPS